MTADAVAAAVAVARGFGLTDPNPVVLANGSNVLVHLWPFPVVARVATLTAELRPGVAAWLARDVEVAAFAAERGVPVVPPSVDPPPGPHVRDGRVLTFFQYVPHDPDHRPAPEEVGRALAALHEALRDYGGELPANGPVDDLWRILDALDRDRILPGEELAALRADLSSSAAEVLALPVRALHGDAHPGNLLATPNGLVWNDFEDTWRGPLAWDLACLATTDRLDGMAALAAYPEPPPAHEIDVCVRLRTLFGVAWRFVLDQWIPGRAPDAREHLDRWLLARPG
jgi:hypothetical protein